MSKLLLITDNFPPRQGGIANVAHLFCRSFPADQIAVVAPRDSGSRTVWDPTTAGEIAAMDAREAFPIDRVPYRGLSGNSLVTFLSQFSLAFHALRSYRRHQCGFVLLASMWPLVLQGYFLRLFGIPFAVYCHVPGVLLDKGGLRKRLCIGGLRRADRVVANSEWVRQFVLKAGVSSEKTVLIYPKVALDSLRCPDGLDLFREREGLKGQRVLLTVGRVYPLKGQHKVIEALPKILERHPETVYVVMGAGPDMETLKTLARDRGVADRVIFPGNRDLAAFLHACDVFLMPSQPVGDAAETFGIVALEAAACGKPVIAGNNGGMPEAVSDGETGILVDPSRPDEIADAAIRLLEDDALRLKLGSQGRARVESKFASKRYLEEFQELVQAPRPHD